MDEADDKFLVRARNCTVERSRVDHAPSVGFEELEGLPTNLVLPREGDGSRLTDEGRRWPGSKARR